VGFLRVTGALAYGVAVILAQSPDTITPTGNLTLPRAYHTGTLLPNGKVLIAGVSREYIPATKWASAELYDPSTGTFTPTGDMSVPRQWHTATLLPTGQVLIAGGGLNGAAGSTAIKGQSSTHRRTRLSHRQTLAPPERR
jgi:hypothetical protein